MDEDVAKLLLEALNRFGKMNPDTLLHSVSEEPLNRAKHPNSMAAHCRLQDRRRLGKAAYHELPHLVEAARSKE